MPPSRTSFLMNVYLILLKIKSHACAIFLECALCYAQVVVTSGEVHRRMGLKNCMPAVCNALRREKFQVDYNVELVQEVRLSTVKGDSSTNKYNFKIL